MMRRKQSFRFLTSPSGKATILSILKKVKRKRATISRPLSFSDLYRFLAKNEAAFVRRFLRLSPRQYGFKGPYLGIQPVPKNLVKIQRQRYRENRKSKVVPMQYLPESVFTSFRKMNQAMMKEIGRFLLVESGYRSPARQVLTFFATLRHHKFSFYKAVRHAAFPGYSEHGFPKHQAIDFLTTEGIPSSDNLFGFAKTKEYSWLLKNAHRFGFRLSYPKNNKLGIMFEPWHWRFGR